MIIRTDHQELIDVIKDLTRYTEDCNHWPRDPDSCATCAGKEISEAEFIIVVPRQPVVRNKGYKKTPAGQGPGF
jgi:hypothetical protein